MSEDVVVEGNPTYSKSPVNTEGEVIGKDDNKDDNNKDDNGEGGDIARISLANNAQITFAANGKTSYSTAFTGNKITPVVVVKVADETLTANIDYSVSYSNNINAGTATITVTGMGDYDGAVSASFTIAKKSIASGKITMAAKAIYTGKSLTPKVKLVMGSTTLTLNKDFKVAYSNNKNFGKAKVVITGIGNYTGNVVKYFNIVTSKGKVYQSGNFKYKITNPALTGKGTVTLSSVVKKTSSVAIPATVKIGGKVFKVTAVGASAFKGNKTLKTVTFGKNVTTIGSKAFYGCTALKTLGTLTSVTTIGTSAFYGCTALTTVKSLGKVKTIGTGAFYKCKKLSSVTIPATVTTIGAKAFYGCTALKTLIIKSSKLTSKNVGKNAFTGTAKKLTVKVPAKKLKAYKTLIKARGVSSKAVIKK
jgi:hypothetical protein